MQFLALKVACSVLVGVILKHAEQARLNRLAVIRVNYAAAAIVAFVVLLLQPYRAPSPTTIWVGLLAGVSYVVALVLWARAIAQSGIALTVGFTRVSIVIPMVLSVVLWHEVPGLLKWVGIALGLAAVLLLSLNQGPGRETGGTGARAGPRINMSLLALFLASGVAGLSSKLFQELCPPEENLQFQVLLFLVAFALTTILYYRQRARVETRALQWGTALGVVNLGSSVFMVLALMAVAGTLAFPVSAALEVAVIALLGRLVWREPLSRRTLVGLALTAAALVLVNLPG